MSKPVLLLERLQEMAERHEYLMELAPLHSDERIVQSHAAVDIKQAIEWITLESDRRNTQ